ncbi:hypothetical protein LCGC14_3125520, partial [marine sediment metagenome]
MKKPVAYKDPSEKFWAEDPFDIYLPTPGFVSDFILATRGMATPTIFSVWVALFMLSTAIKREAWFKWFPDPIYPNLYVIFVAPPKICAKSVSARLGGQILSVFPDSIDDLGLQTKKRITISKAKITPEAISSLLTVPYVAIPGGKGIIRVKLYPQVCFLVSELGTFLGKQLYNVGLIDRLTNLYDCADDEDDTLSRGIKHFENVYVTLLGATTAESLTNTLPEEAFGGGFMSRVILVWQEKSTRIYPMPKEVHGSPTLEILAQRLAWIATHTQGEYVFEEKAQKAYEEWFFEHHSMLEKEEYEKRKEMLYRFDIHLLKV